MSYTKKLPNSEKIYVIDFFSGCGGMSEGFRTTRQSHLSYEIIAGIDIDSNALETYEKNIGVKGINFNIGEIAENPALLKSIIPEFDPDIHRPLLFIGCAPCQGFSAHRKKDMRDDPRNSLMACFANICNFYRPDYLIMENVPEIVSGKYKDYFIRASEILESAGYNLNLDTFDLSLYGVPQRRRRAVVMGSLKDVITLPAPIFTKDTARTVRDAISHLNPIEAGHTDSYDKFHRAPNHTDRIIERIKKTPVDGGDRRTLTASEQLDCHISVDNGRTPGFTDVYGRLRWDTPSVTITAKSSTPSCGRFLHPEQHRNISVREAAILQGFPQYYEFVGPLTSQYRQIGEAVPPLFARFLANQILDHIQPKNKVITDILTKPNKVFRSGKNRQDCDIVSVDLFSGAGGLSLGLEAAGIPSVLAVDADHDAVESYKHNIRSVAQVADVSNDLIVKDIQSKVGNKLFVLAGGPPCQGFSQQRRGNNLDERNNLVLRFAEIGLSLENKPVAVVLENVTYLDSPRGEKILSEYSLMMEKAGYSLFRHDLNSAEYGVPQLRRRIIIVALRKEYCEYYQGPRRLTAKRWPAVGEVLCDLPEALPKAELALVPNHEPSREGSLNKRRIAFVDMGKGRMAVPESLQLKCHQNYNGHLDVYGRLDWFSQARTITGGFDSFTRGEYGHPFSHRSITAREAARIQGFPDWFFFIGNRSSVRRQIGNAVPPPVGYAIGKGIFSAVKKVMKRKI